ncbi:hypothetical protein BDD14_0642 [Edaphobacter modestus]|uniref:Uncharacterized protein n=1 Tax=Edaphobacter modestus TaxID=388466 RepID=A0A4Q7YQU4_9BACT|nr:hypothetical protein BDD14_0642 [Edaphobacter modestus]
MPVPPISMQRFNLYEAETLMGQFSYIAPELEDDAFLMISDRLYKTTEISS